MKKYILILWSVLSFAQGSNSMVTFTEAQSLGFSLNSGQSHVTSQSCMTKSDILTKYNVSATPMSGYGNNYLVPRSAWTSGVIGTSYTVYEGVGGGDGTCGNTSFDLTWYSSSTSITVGMTFYNDVGLTNPVARSYIVYHVTSNKLLNVNSSGVLTSTTNCVAPPTYEIMQLNFAATGGSSTVCSVSNPATRYSDTGILGTATVLYSDQNGSSTAPTGYYKDIDSFYRFWNGTSFSDYSNCNF